MSNQEKPCPFCGSEAAWFSYSNGEYDVKCRNPMCLSKSGRWDTMAEAVAAWNRRYERTCHHDGVNFHDVFICSECGCQTQGDQYGELPKYCSNCGAKVIGG